MCLKTNIEPPSSYHMSCLELQPGWPSIPPLSPTATQLHEKRRFDCDHQVYICVYFCQKTKTIINISIFCEFIFNSDSIPMHTYLQVGILVVKNGSFDVVKGVNASFWGITLEQKMKGYRRYLTKERLRKPIPHDNSPVMVTEHGTHSSINQFS